MAVTSKPEDTLTSLHRFGTSARARLTERTTTLVQSAGHMMEKYPPIKAFVYTLAGASAVPLTVFAGFALATTAVVLGIAGGWWWWRGGVSPPLARICTLGAWSGSKDGYSL